MLPAALLVILLLADHRQNTWEDAMKTQYTVALATLGGIAIGAVAVQGLHAQAKPPAIVIVDISEITDPEGFKVITQRPTASTATVMQGGHYITRTDKINPLDGTAPKRFIVISFESAEKAEAWNNSSAQKEINAIRAKTTKSRSFIVEGM
jgi:uncharacterized protein (DUF1330 family)